MKIKKGDNVMIMKGKDRGKSGKVALVSLKTNKIIIHGLNQVKKAVRPKKQDEKGQIVSVARPMSIANVMVICPSCGKPSRIGFLTDKGKKQRICKRCKGII